MRGKQRLWAPVLAVLVHVAVLAGLLGDLSVTPPAEPVFLSLYDGAGPTAGPARGPSAAAGAAAAEPAAQQPAEAPPAEPSPPEPAAEPPPPPPEPASPAEAAPAPEPANEALAPPLPDLTAEAAEPQAEALAAALASAEAAAAAEYGSGALADLGALSGGGDRCGLGEWLQATLQNDPDVRVALSQVPRGARSVANAVMLWNGAWVEARGYDGRDTLAPIRRMIADGLRTAPSQCRDEVMTGPRFIAVGDSAQTTVLAVGSGLWRWSDLLVGAPLADARRVGNFPHPFTRVPIDKVRRSWEAYP